MSHRNVSWMDGALCARVDAELFHPTRGGRQIRPARVVCDQCPVRRDCINHAITANIRSGVWGGYSGNQLVALVRAGSQLTSLPPYSRRGKLAPIT